MSLHSNYELDKMLSEFLSTLKHSYSTCSLDYPRNQCVSFLRSTHYLEKLASPAIHGISDLVLIVPSDISVSVPEGICLYRTENVDLLFTLYNNYARKAENPSQLDVFGKNVHIHPSVIVGAEGLSIVTYGSERIQFKHCGRVIIEDSVHIGPCSVIQRGRLDDTLIGTGTMISSLCAIGHNTHIGKNCTIAIHAAISGSVRIGNNCWIGIGAMIRNNVTICDDVTIGVGSVVVKDILHPGTYAGNPCRLLYN